MGFRSFWALCARAWPEAEPCVGVCGHVSVEVISLNFLLKCQPTRSWWGVNTPIEGCCSACAAVQVQPRDPAWMGAPAQHTAPCTAPCWGSSRGQQGQCVFLGTGWCGELEPEVFYRGMNGLIWEGALLSCYLCLKSCLFFSEVFHLFFIPAQ